MRWIRKFLHRCFPEPTRPYILTGILVLVILLVFYGTEKVDSRSDSNSMRPALSSGDRYFVVRNFEPKRFDIVIAANPENPEEFLIKRIVGLPGERFEMRKGVVLINGKVLLETYFFDNRGRGTGWFPQSSSTSSYTIPSGRFFLLGDNRDTSLDSRHFGTFAKNSFHGKVVVVMWPPPHIKFFFRN